MRRLGLHTSIAGGLHMAIERGRALGCTCVQIFSHNPRGWAVSEVFASDAEEFRRLRVEYGIGPVFVHTSYLLNIASPDEALRKKSLDMLRQEMLRADAIGAEYVVTHTGTAHDGHGIERAGGSIREAIGGLKTSAGLLLENTSGKRGDIATAVSDLAALMEASGGLPSGVCIDSCHAFAAGYDIRKPEEVMRIGEEAVRLLGRDAVRLIHLNDSKGEPGTGLDRHEHLGQGAIGIEGLRLFVSHPAFAGAPVVLETPRESDDDDLMNLALAREIMGIENISAPARQPQRHSKSGAKAPGSSKKIKTKSGKVHGGGQKR